MQLKCWINDVLRKFINLLFPFLGIKLYLLFVWCIIFTQTFSYKASLRISKIWDHSVCDFHLHWGLCHGLVLKTTLMCLNSRFNSKVFVFFLVLLLILDEERWAWMKRHRQLSIHIVDFFSPHMAWKQGICHATFSFIVSAICDINICNTQNLA